MSDARPRLGLIWAQARGGVIGRDGDMPWHLPADLAHFRAVTLGSPVVMGRRTWESLPERFRPLPGRPNIVVTRNASWQAEGAIVVTSPAAALERAAELAMAAREPAQAEPAQAEQAEWIWVIGGGELYRTAIALADRLEVTEIAADIEGDTLGPEIGSEWREVSSDPEVGEHRDAAADLGFRFVRYERAKRADSSRAIPAT